MSRRPVTRPRQAMSARQVDRVEVSVKILDGYVKELMGPMAERTRLRILRLMALRLARLLASVRRSERR